jgi:uncharacterized protein (TIGR02246 family)
MKYFVGLSLTTSLMMAGPAAPSQTAPVDTKADIQKVATAYTDAYNKQDAATIAKMYAQDAVFPNPGWTAFGRTAIEDALNKDLAARTFSKINSITVDQAHRVGNLDYSAGTWTADAKGSDGNEGPVNGHWLVIWA